MHAVERSETRDRQARMSCSVVSPRPAGRFSPVGQAHSMEPPLLQLTLPYWGQGGVHWPGAGVDPASRCAAELP